MNQRVIFQSVEERIVYLQTLTGENLSLICSEIQVRQIDELKYLLYPGMKLQLLHTQTVEKGCVSCEFFIIEPDYLMDISSLSECYRPYGNHPLNYTLSRFRIPENTRHILLGNTANYFIDVLVNEQPDKPVEFIRCMKDLFKTAPFEFTACDDLKDKETERNFFISCEAQFRQIREIVSRQFPCAGIDREKVVLEPSFICNLLGLQGRLDIMQQDFSSFVELKSGKGDEDFPSRTFKSSSLNHYVQMILYLAVLEFNLKILPEQVRSYLLYSKYPVLSPEPHSRERLREVLHLRNRIIAQEHSIQYHNNVVYTETVLSQITAENLNTEFLSGNFFEKYLCPPIVDFRRMIDSLTEAERAYFFRIYTFVIKELWTSKVGEREYEGVRRSAGLWNAPEAEKIAASEFLYDLCIVENQAAEEKHSLILSLPDYPDHYLPNFKPGDAVVLYEWRSGSGRQYTLNDRQVFKASIEEIEPGLLKLRLRARQRNVSVLPVDSHYAVEHDYIDTVYGGMFRGLAAFTHANQERKDLLLGLRKPVFRERMEITENHNALSGDIHHIARKALSAEDCFLLLGPPGTGKTSLALKAMVETFLQGNDTLSGCNASDSSVSQKNLLLLSYTNRAVDEICKVLTDMNEQVPFIRIGNELNCDPRFRSHLMDRMLDACDNRSEVSRIIQDTRIIAGTVASVWNKPDLFRIKHFDLAIIDEATQLLEPHLLGILSVKGKNNRHAVDRFVLIGDHKQLPAVVLQTREDSRVADEQLLPTGLTNLADSLFERLYHVYERNSWTDSYDMLYRQGRMHPEIASFPSLHFYDGKLDIAGLPHQQEDAKVPSPFRQRLVFIPSSHSPEDTGDKVNHREAGTVARVLTDLYNYCVANGNEFNKETVGVITPYRNQIALIRKYIHQTGIEALKQVIVDTVECFQGSQKDIIIYSFCLNADWQLQSTQHRTEINGKPVDRKLNVALTRARKQLIITGNPELMKRNFLYREMMGNFKELAIKST